MKIRAISVYSIEIPIKGGYRLSGDRNFQSVDSTVVIVDTDVGISGVGESCPFGTLYLPAHAKGVRAGLDDVAPHLIGLDPRNLGAINMAMDRALMGHPHVKTAVDMACWDILGKAVSMPVFALMGGKISAEIPLRIGLPAGSPESMRANIERRKKEGYRLFSAKVGNDVSKDVECLNALADTTDSSDIIVADANGGWTRSQAVRVLLGVRDIGRFSFEQPCATYDECLAARRTTSAEFVLDESMVSVTTLIHALKDNACEAINLKIGRVGGLTKAKLMRDLCVESGIGLHVQDSWGGDIIGAAIAHIAHSTHPRHLIGAWSPMEWSDLRIAHGAPTSANGVMVSNDEPGLGVTVCMEALGRPVARFE